MKLQTQPNKFSCLPTSFAMVLGEPIENTIKALGHDGSELLKDNVPRCFHDQELAYYALNKGYATITFEPFITILDQMGNPYIFQNIFLNDLMIGKSGVITGLTRANKPHAVAWDGQKIYDPNGFIYDLDSFQIHCFYLIVPIRVAESESA